MVRWQVTWGFWLVSWILIWCSLFTGSFMFQGVMEPGFAWQTQPQPQDWATPTRDKPGELRYISPPPPNSQSTGLHIRVQCWNPASRPNPSHGRKNNNTQLLPRNGWNKQPFRFWEPLEPSPMFWIWPYSTHSAPGHSSLELRGPSVF